MAKKSRVKSHTRKTSQLSGYRARKGTHVKSHMRRKKK